MSRPRKSSLYNLDILGASPPLDKEERPQRRHTFSGMQRASYHHHQQCIPTMPSFHGGAARPLPTPPALHPALDFTGQMLRPHHQTQSTVRCDFLMPNSIIISLNVSVSHTLAEIKAELWEKASEYPLFGTLHDLSTYHFACISQRAETVELMDESKCLQEIGPFLYILKVVERKGNETEKLLNSQIGQLIGKDLQKFDALKNPEVNDFRWKMKVICDCVVTDRKKQSWSEQVQYQYPARIAAHPELPQYICNRLQDGQLFISVQFDTSMRVQSTFTFRVLPETKPAVFLEQALNKKFNTFMQGKETQGKEAAQEYVLKRPGCEEYLTSDVPLSQYEYVREYVCQDEIQPIPLIIVHRGTIQVDIENVYEHIEDFGLKTLRSSFSTMTLTKSRPNLISSWTVEHLFSFRVGTISKMNLDSEDSEVVVEAGLYHGNHPLCDTKHTPKIQLNDGDAVVDEDLTFPIKVCNIPKSTRLCIAIYEVNRTTKAVKSRPQTVSSKEELYKSPIGWVNTSVYDYRNQLKGGSMTLYAWNGSEDQCGEVEMPNPLGTVVSNPDHERALTLTITFTRYGSNSTIVYPAKEKIINKALENPQHSELEPSTQQKIELQQIEARDPLTELNEQERIMLWSLRNYILRKMPSLLPKVLLSVEWDNNSVVAEMITLLDKWPKLPPERALEMLDYAYAESYVRQYAIECLQDVSDDDLLLYLLQLVQALKHENFLYCNLVEYLLNRSLRNMRIGHFFFWHLRAEMHVPSVSIRFGLILEAYCRGSVEHMRGLLKQQEFVNKCKDIKELVASQRGNQSLALKNMKEFMKKPVHQSALSQFLNPIDPLYRIRQIKVDECKFKDSKMAPLWLVFENSDLHGKDIYLLYKSGDDLRQDMLTLQMIRIMDKLWKDHGLDLRMIPYSCMSTDNNEGIIQVVLNAETIANIQRAKGMFSATSAFRKGSLLDWLKEHNSGEAALNKAIHEFTLSCAGYCVATYVLGIADRHSDNIMIMQNGQLFHIDFGHILGHFKEKFGIKRERQPFVLTHDFIHVITKGRQTRSEEFIKFKEYCEQAFEILRQYGSFIISLFAMMISTGLPELQSEKDLDYLKETLKLDLSKEEALDHFRSKFDEALSNAWKTSVNWAFHAMAKNNR